MTLPAGQPGRRARRAPAGIRRHCDLHVVLHYETRRVRGGGRSASERPRDRKTQARATIRLPLHVCRADMSRQVDRPRNFTVEAAGEIPRRSGIAGPASINGSSTTTASGLISNTAIRDAGPLKRSACSVTRKVKGTSRIESPANLTGRWPRRPTHLSRPRHDGPERGSHPSASRRDPATALAAAFTGSAARCA